MPVDRVERAQQAGERAAFLAVDAVEGRVLRDEQQFLHAARGQLPAPRARSTRPAGCDSAPRSVGMMQNAHL